MMTYCRCRATLSKNCLFQHLRCAQSSSLIFPTWRSYPLVDPIHVIVFSTVITGEWWRVYMKDAKIFNILTILIFLIFQIQTSFLHGLKTFDLNPRSFATIQYWHICRDLTCHTCLSWKMSNMIWNWNWIMARFLRKLILFLFFIQMSKCILNYILSL